MWSVDTITIKGEVRVSDKEVVLGTVQEKNTANQVAFLRVLK